MSSGFTSNVEELIEQKYNSCYIRTTKGFKPAIEENQAPQMDQQEIERREKMLDDFRRFQPRIPQHLQDTLNAGVAEEARSALLEILILAVQFGRYAQQEDDIDAAVEIYKRQQAALEAAKAKKAAESKLALALVDRQGRELRANQPAQVQPQPVQGELELIVVPGHACPTKVQ